MKAYNTDLKFKKNCIQMAKRHVENKILCGHRQKSIETNKYRIGYKIPCDNFNKYGKTSIASDVYSIVEEKGIPFNTESIEKIVEPSAIEDTQVFLSWHNLRKVKESELPPNFVEQIVVDRYGYFITSKYFGFPVWLEEVREIVFSGLPESKRGDWHINFKTCMPVGLSEMDLNRVKDKISSYIYSVNIECVNHLNIPRNLKDNIIEIYSNSKNELDKENVYKLLPSISVMVLELAESNDEAGMIEMKYAELLVTSIIIDSLGKKIELEKKKLDIALLANRIKKEKDRSELLERLKKLMDINVCCDLSGVIIDELTCKGT